MEGTRFLACLLLAIALFSGGFGTTVFVSPSGDDGNAGTEESPWGSLTHAFAVMGDDDEVHLLPGVHYLDNSITISSRTNLIGAGARDEVIVDMSANVAFEIASPITMRGFTIRNTDTEGALYLNSDPPAELRDITFMNGGTNTGALSQLSFYRLESPITMRGLYFIGNRAMHGGAVKVQNVVADVTFEDCKFIGNKAQATGGAIYTSDTTNKIYFNNCEFTGNVAATSGGVVMSNHAGGLSFVGCTFRDNSCPQGGAVRKAVGSLYIEGCTFTHNNATSAANTAQGGAVSATCDTTVVDSEFTSNGARGYIDSSGGALMLNSAPSTINITRCVFADNWVESTISNANGGAVFYTTAADTTVAVDDCTFSENQVTGANIGLGGAVFAIATNVPSQFTGCSFTDNTLFSSLVTGDHRGGAVYAEQAAFSHCTFTGNAIRTTFPSGDGVVGGAALFCVGNGQSIQNTSFYSNVIDVPIDVHGGIVYLSNMMVEDVWIDSNTVSARSAIAAVVLVDSGSVKFLTVNENNVNVLGSMLYIASLINMENTVIDDITASGNNVHFYVVTYGVYSISGTLHISYHDDTPDKKRGAAAKRGPGVGALTAQHITVEDNTFGGVDAPVAVHCYGVGLVVSDGLYTDVVVRNNRGDCYYLSGAGVYVQSDDGAELKFSHSDISNNMSPANWAWGGGLHALSATVTLETVSISGNVLGGQYSQGAGVYFNSVATVLSFLTVSDNVGENAQSVGGGMFITDTDVLAIVFTVVQHNSAGAAGGLFFKNAVLSLSQLSLCNNEALTGKGANLLGDSATFQNVPPAGDPDCNVRDCYGVVGGETILDLCNVCDGTGRSCCGDIGEMTHDGCHCFEDHGDLGDPCGDGCALVRDACGVCGGNNRSCCSDRGVFDGEHCYCEGVACGLSCQLDTLCGECGCCFDRCLFVDSDHGRDEFRSGSAESPFATISHALHVADGPTTIYLLSSYYRYGGFRSKGKAIRIEPVLGGVATIDCMGGYSDTRGLSLWGNDEAPLHVQNINFVDCNGGGLSLNNATVYVSNVTVEHSGSTDAVGGGILLNDIGPGSVVTGVRLVNNTASVGGGIAVILSRDGETDLVVRDSTILANYADGDGGGIFISRGTEAEEATPQKKASKWATNEFRAGAVLACIRLLREFGSMYSQYEAFAELITPAVRVLSAVTKCRVPSVVLQAAKDAHKQLTTLTGHCLSLRRPLQLQKRKAVAIRTYNPRVEEKFDPDRKYDPDRERAEKAKAKRKYRSELKGAVRELRKDNAFLQAERVKEQSAARAERDANYRRVLSFVQQQQHENKHLSKNRA